MKPKILIVDNDKFMQKILDKLFSKIYTVKTVDSGEEALDHIESGFIPAVVVTGNVLTGMRGSTLLGKIKELHPETSRIILTSIDETKEVINILNESDAFMFLAKPFNNLQLINTVKRGTQRYNDRMKLSKITPDLQSKVAKENELTQELNDLKEKTNAIVSDTVVALSNFIKPSQNFYFKDHTTDVVQMAKVLAQKLELKENDMTELIYGGLLAGHYLVGLPDKYKVADLYELSDKKDIKTFFDHFKMSLAGLKKIKVLSRYIDVAATIFERMDGNGHPFNLTGIDIPKTTQCLMICKIYHDQLYKLNAEELEILKYEGKIIQNRSVTLAKYQNAIKYLYKRLKWFDHDLFYKFNDLIKKRDNRAFKIPREDLIIDYDKDQWQNPDFKGNSQEEMQIRMKHLKRTKVQVTNPDGKLLSTYIEYLTTVDELEEGWELLDDYSNFEGTLIAAKGTKLSSDAIEKIKILARNREGSRVVTVKIEEVFNT